MLFSVSYVHTHELGAVHHLHCCVVDEQLRATRMALSEVAFVLSTHRRELLFQAASIKPLEALHHYGSQCYGVVVIQPGYCGLVWLWLSWNMMVQWTQASWSVHSLSRCPAAFLKLTFFRVLQTSEVSLDSVCSPGWGSDFLTVMLFRASWSPGWEAERTHGNPHSPTEIWIQDRDYCLQ